MFDVKRIFQGNDFHYIFKDLLSSLVKSPQFVCKPRGQKVKENLVTTIILNDPTHRLLYSKKRNINYGFAVGEFLWYWMGQQDLDTMLYYNKRMKEFSDDGKTLNSAYGYRIKKMFFSEDNHLKVSQWHSAIKTLIDDPDSRRAVILINMPLDNIKATYTGSKDVPCTLSLQFFIRNNELNLHVNMRSNDVIWGLPYDLFSFTLLQECMLLELAKSNKFIDLKLGKYYHTAGSIHLYERHFKLAEDIINEQDNDEEFDLTLGMKSLYNLQHLTMLSKLESMLRVNICDKKMLDVMQNSMTDGVQFMMNCLLQHREKRNNEVKSC